jgi:hypothetical protein
MDFLDTMNEEKNVAFLGFALGTLLPATFPKLCGTTSMNSMTRPVTSTCSLPVWLKITRGLVGATFGCIIGRQFVDLKFGDGYLITELFKSVSVRFIIINKLFQVFLHTQLKQETNVQLPYQEPTPIHLRASS